jgi:hypothetical protein
VGVKILGQTLAIGLLALAVAAPAAAAPRAKTRFDGLRDCERLARVQFGQRNPAFKRFSIDRASVKVDKYADKVGSVFVSTVYHGKATYEAARGPHSSNFICLHGGVGNDAVFVYSMAE